MAEWSKAHDWKSCIPLKGIQGSNPCLSAIYTKPCPARGFVLSAADAKFYRRKPGQSHFLKTKKAANKINKKPTISFHFSPSLR